MSMYPAVQGAAAGKWNLGRHSVGDSIARMSGAMAGGSILVGPWTVSAAGATEAGPRATNDDEFLIAQLGAPDERGVYPAQWLAVADGVGGLPAAQEASCVVVQVVLDHWRKRFGELVEAGERIRKLGAEIAHEAFADAEQALARLQTEQWLSRTPGSTLTGALIVGKNLLWIHAGDTRCYVLRGQELRQLTTDHNIFTQIHDSGVLDVNPALKSYLTNCIGADTGVARADVGVWELASGDVVLLCSDGLSNSVDEHVLRTALGERVDPVHCAQMLVRRAVENETNDNVTVLVARVE